MDENTPAIDPRRTALLVMDYQAGIVGRIADAEELLTRMRAAIDVARQHGMAVGYVRVAFTDDEHEGVPEHNKTFSALARQGSTMHADAPETAVHDAVAPAPGDIVVRKQRVGPFSTTDLAEQLAGPRHRHARVGRHQHQRGGALRRASRRRCRLPALRTLRRDRRH